MYTIMYVQLHTYIYISTHSEAYQRLKEERSGVLWDAVERVLPGACVCVMCICVYVCVSQRVCVCVCHVFPVTLKRKEGLVVYAVPCIHVLVDPSILRVEDVHGSACICIYNMYVTMCVLCIGLYIQLYMYALTHLYHTLISYTHTC